jgi:hypothetical protein
LFAGSYAYGDDDSGIATLTICNKGSVHISVVVAVAPDLFLGTILDVNGWTNLSPGDCKRVYKESGTYDNGAEPAYIGFGFADSQDRITSAGHIEQVPDFGQFRFGTKVLTKWDKRLCVSNNGCRTGAAAIRRSAARPLITAGTIREDIFRLRQRFISLLSPPIASPRVLSGKSLAAAGTTT